MHPTAHRWDVTPEEAEQIQRCLHGQVVTEDLFGEVRHVAGVDVGFEDDFAVTRAAVAVLVFPSLALCEHRIARRPTTFPYIPGLLSFREVPAVLDALENLSTRPDLLLCDGQGIAHPRRFGIACHIGVLTGLPTIGVAKSRLVGHYKAPPEEKGAWTPLRYRGETVGAVVRTRAGVRPVFVSPGHKVSLSSAIAYTLRCTTRYRLPETTRRANRLASGK